MKSSWLLKKLIMKSRERTISARIGWAILSIFPPAALEAPANAVVASQYPPAVNNFFLIACRDNTWTRGTVAAAVLARD
jgi:hypothetical protein